MDGSQTLLMSNEIDRTEQKKTQLKTAHPPTKVLKQEGNTDGSEMYPRRAEVVSAALLGCAQLGLTSAHHTAQESVATAV